MPRILGPQSTKHLSWNPRWGQATASLICAALIVIAGLLGPVQPASAPHWAPTSGVNASFGCYGVYHMVRAGQTIYSIAAWYGTTAYRIARCNGLASYTVYVGQTLMVPTYQPYWRGSNTPSYWPSNR